MRWSRRRAGWAAGSLGLGDPVIAYNPSTGQAEAEPIRHVWLNHDDLVDVRVQTAQTTPATDSGATPHTATTASSTSRVANAVKVVAAVASLALTLATGHAVAIPTSAMAATQATGQAETIHTTANHPWLTADRGWVQAGDLRAGEPVVTLNGAVGTPLSARSRVHYADPA